MGMVGPRAARFWRRLGLLAAAAFALAWVGSGGLVVERSAQVTRFPFIGDSGVDLQVVNPPAPGVPLVVRYDSGRARLGLRVTYITHAAVEDPEFVVDWCDLAFPDGTRIDLAEPARAGLGRPRPFLHEYVSRVGEQRGKPGLTGEFTVTDCFPPDQSFVFRIKGRLCSRGQVVQECEQTINDRPSGQTRVRVCWLWLDWSRW
jgi:hypothetical protein